MNISRNYYFNMYLKVRVFTRASLKRLDALSSGYARLKTRVE